MKNKNLIGDDGKKVRQKESISNISVLLLLYILTIVLSVGI